MKRSTTRLLSIFSCALFPVVATMGQLPERFTLGRYIPGDVWLYMNAARNPEREWLNQQWAEVFDALRATGIEKDIMSLVLAQADDQGRAEAKAEVAKWAELVHAIGWQDLIAEEFAFAERFAAGPVGAEYFLLARGKAGTAEQNMAALVAVLKEVTALSDKVSLSRRDEGDVTVWSLSFAADTEAADAVSPQLFRKGDIIGFASAPDAFKQVGDLMSGKADQAAIAAAPRFQAALKKVKAPQDFLSFFDARAFLADLDRSVKTRHAGGEDDGAGEKAMLAIKKVLEIADVLDYTIVSVETDGHRQLTHQVAELQAARCESKLASCYLDRKLFQRFDEFIPADATGFQVNTLIDLEKVYEVVLDFIGNNIPGGQDVVRQITGAMAAFGFEPQRDLFSWWSGEMISISMPPAIVTPMSGSDWVTMIRVKDSEIASEKIGAGLDFLSAMLKGHGQALMMTPTDVNGAEGFTAVTHPLLAMVLRPVVGVRGDWLIIGSSPAVIAKCLAVQAGKAPSIRENARFKREGLIPSGPVLSASFTDTSKLGQEIGGAIGMAGMMGGMMAGSIDDPEAKNIVQKLMTTVVKLGPVFQKLDFFSSEASMTAYDGATTVRTESVVTYKDPQAGGEKSARAKR